MIHARDHPAPRPSPSQRPQPAHRRGCCCEPPGGVRRHGARKRAPVVPHRRHPDQASQVHRLAPVAARHLLQAPEHLRAVRPVEHELRRPDQRLLRPHDHHRGPQVHGVRGAFGRRPARRAVGLPELLQPEGHVRLLGSRRRLRHRDQGERARRAQRAPARDHARLPELRRVGALELQRLGHDQGRCLDEGQRLEVRLHHVVPEGQVGRDVLRLRAVALPLRGPGDGRQGPRERAHPARVPVEAADRAATDAHADAHSETVADAYPEPVADSHFNTDAHAHTDA